MEQSLGKEETMKPKWPVRLDGTTYHAVVEPGIEQQAGNHLQCASAPVDGGGAGEERWHWQQSWW